MERPQPMTALAQRVYRLLLTGRDLGAEDLAVELAGTGGPVGPTEVERALDELTALALLRPSGRAPAGLRPVGPEAGLRLLQNHQAELLRQQQDLAVSQAALTRLLSGGGCSCSGRPEYAAETLVGSDAIGARIETLAARAVFEVAVFLPGVAELPAMLHASRPLDRAVRHRGVSLRTVALDSARHRRPSLAHLRWLGGIGAQVRTSPTLPLRMAVYDRHTAVVPLDPEGRESGAVQLTGPGVLTAVLALFDSVWATATPIDQPLPRNTDGLTPQERQLLQLLAEGHTDEGAGRQLGLAPRTVRRIMAGLMARLGARSRFEAGLEAGRRGWI
ncbi:helix-turn-helix transcriptional regulator [Streptomyces sp. NPDC089919]|uniref:helix-turn-helix transcriptional regulator n=1 Tax=Streptomyces sp. NPDC089919 TaxID=3155188 RepID=UPI003418D16C